MSAIPFSRRAMSAIFWSQWAYWCALAMAIFALSALPPGGIRNVLVMTPIAPGLLVFAVCFWLYRSCDEYVRMRTLQAAATTAFVVAMLSMVYFFLELLGLPRLSMMWIHIVGWSIFDAQMLWLLLRPR
jgi:hypothetical protein